MSRVLELTKRILAMVVVMALAFSVVPLTEQYNAYAKAEKTNEEYAYQFIRNNIGLNMAATCGMLANLNSESGIRPNNVENVAEAQLISAKTGEKYKGNVDKEYTAEINAGLITREQFAQTKMKNSDGTKRYFGYGLCQWTSKGRKEALYDFAVEYAQKNNIKFDIASLDMQLCFLQKELSESYPQTWNTLKKVPDSEVGTYLAAFIMCTDFEIPAYTQITSYSRAKYALTEYWDRYSEIASSESGNSYLGICGYYYPTKLKKGNGMSVLGYVVSNQKIKSITARIVDANGKDKYKYTDTKKADTAPYCYNLLYTANSSGVTADDKLLFSKLDEGKYRYIVSATDFKDKTLTFEKSFTVSAGYSSGVKYYGTTCLDLSTLGITDYTVPTKLKKGNQYDNVGIVSSNYDLKQVAIRILNSDGKSVAYATAKPNAKKYDISQLNEGLDLSTLAGGQYTYRLYAKDYLKGIYLIKETFFVDSKAVENPVIPTSIPAGKDFTIKGIVTSDVDISSIVIRVTDADGATITTKKLYPKKSTYDLNNANKYIDFGQCQKGKYRYKVSATDEAGTKVLINKEFSVYTPSKARIVSYNYPTKIKAGKGFSIYGTVKSNYYLKKVKINIVNSKGKVVISASADLKGMKKLKYSVKELDSKMTFGKLAKGTYRYKVSVTDSKITRTVLNKKFSVK